jgi:hypothetical protein
MWVCRRLLTRVELAALTSMGDRNMATHFPSRDTQPFPLRQLQMFIILFILRDPLVREFNAYLFKEAVICVLEAPETSFGRLPAIGSSFHSVSLTLGVSSPGSKSPLRHKGRIYIRRIKRPLDASITDELSCAIDTEDESRELVTPRPATRPAPTRGLVRVHLPDYQDHTNGRS